MTRNIIFNLHYLYLLYFLDIKPITQDTSLQLKKSNAI